MRAILHVLLFVLLTPCLSLHARADLAVASWNIQNFGWGENKSYQAVARVASQFDILAIQELMNADAIETLRGLLEEKTEESWSVMYSHRLGRGRYQEKYAFIWRDSTVEYLDGAVVYLDSRDVFAREPYSARFRSLSSGLTFVLATVHVVYGQRVGDRTPEIQALRKYWDWLEEVYPENVSTRMLLGDFNLRPSHQAWELLTAVAEPLLTEGATTLSSNDRQYANLYDNVFVPKNHDLPVSEVGILQFPVLLTETSGRYWSHEKARRHVSDHAPVYVLLDDRRLYPVRTGDLYTPNRVAAAGAAQEEEVQDEREMDASNCVDLNTASLEELQMIIHIGEARALDVISGRPWSSVQSLTRISGISANRAAQIREQGVVCEP